MKKFLFFASLIILAGCSSQTSTTKQQGPQIIYTIDVTEIDDDLFDVTILANNLTEENNVYNFAATAPGTYHIMDFGRFVESFNAYDGDGNELSVEKISANQWKIENISQLAKISYKINDTFDSDVNKNYPMPMSGSGIDSGYVGFNTFAVLGYFQGLQSYPSRLKLEYNSEWVVGTALNKDEDGYYFSETYDRLADSPILMGELSVATTKVEDIDVEVYVFANDTSITATKILNIADEVLQSSTDFLTYAPVDRYTFLMLLFDWSYYQQNGIMGGGALEHSYSSFYVQPMSPQRLIGLRSTMAHEFMHILTPLHLSSEIIHTYNFEVPTASQHIWLYEGVTEWVSDIMQLRSGITTEDEYLEQFSRKLRINDMYDPNISLVEMSKNVYDQKVNDQFINFYNRGAVTAALLDLRLLELSDGKRGWREVYLDLLQKYGKDNPFPEDKFFDVIVEMTYPEIKQFINDYIKGSEPLPFIEYMDKLGYKYIHEVISDDPRPTMGANISINEDREIILIGVRDEAKKWGIKENDILIEVIGEEVNLGTAMGIANKLFEMNVGDPFNIVIKRDGNEIEINGNLLQRKKKHVFEEMENPTDKQLQYRAAWMKNLER